MQRYIIFLTFKTFLLIYINLLKMIQKLTNCKSLIDSLLEKCYKKGCKIFEKKVTPY